MPGRGMGERLMVDPDDDLQRLFEGLAIDLINSDRMMFGTGATLYGTTNLTAWDSGTAKVKVSVMAQGIEETAVNDLVSPPSGAPLLSALGDVDGFRHTDLTKVPSLVYQSPNWGTSTSIDYAETNPLDVVAAPRCGRRPARR